MSITPAVVGGGVAAFAEGSATSLRANNDNQWSVYMKAGEKVDYTATVAWLSPTGSGNYTLKLINTAGTVVDTCTISTARPVGYTCSLTGTATEDGVWYAVMENDATPYGGFSDPAPLDATNQVQHLDWTIDVSSASGAKIPGRVWVDEVFTGAQRYGNRSATAIRNNATDLTLWYLDDSGWLYEATQTSYNGVYSQLFSNHLGGIDPATGEPFYFSNQVLGSTLQFQGDGNPMYKTFFAKPAADLPTTATWPDGSVRTLDKSDSPVMPAFSGLTFTRSGTGSNAGTLTYSLTDYVGPVTFVIDSNQNGSVDASDVRVTDPIYNGSTDTVTWDGKDASGATVPVSKDTKVWASIDRTGEIHWITRDAELRGGIEVNRLNGPATGRSTIYWNDTNLVESRLNVNSTSQPDGTMGVDSTGGVHDLPVSIDPDGFWGAGNNRFINDWTYVPIDVKADTLIPALTADVRIVKELVSATPLHAGDPIKWKVSITNLGTTTATGVKVDDLLPSNVTGATPTLTNPSKGSVSGTTWTVGDLPVNAVETVVVNGTIAADASGNVVNTATVDSKEDPLPMNPATDECQDNGDLASDSDQCDLVSVPLEKLLPNLRIVKNRVGSGTVGSGDTVTYDVHVDNAGPGDATNVTMNDLADAGLENVTLSGPSKGTVSGTTWTIGNLASGASASIKVTAKVAADASGTLTNFATTSSTENPYTGGTPTTATCQNNDTLAGDDDQCDLAPVTVADPDLRIVKTRTSAAKVKPGDPVTYDVAITNLGRGPATNVTVKDLFPAGTHDGTYVSASKGTTSGDTWTVGTLAPNEVATVGVRVVVDANASGQLTNYATVDSKESPYTGDPKTACQDNSDLQSDSDQCDLAPVTVAKPDLAIVKTLVQAEGVGKGIKWNIEVTNRGDIEATDVVVTEIPPTKVHDTALSDPSKGSVDALVWSVGTLAPGEHATVTVTATIDADAKSVLTNTATVDSPDDPYTGDPTTKCEDNVSLASDSDQCDLVPVDLGKPDLAIVKTLVKAEGVGQGIEWTIEVTNRGPVNADDVTVTEVPPAKVHDTALSDPSKGSVDALVWSVGTLAPGEHATVTVTAVINADAKGTIVNHSTVGSPEQPYTGDPLTKCQDNVSLASDSDQCDLVPVDLGKPDLAIVKTVTAIPAAPGDGIDWLIEVTNRGPVNADDVTVTEVPPSEVHDTALSDPSKGSVDALVWSVGTLAPGEHATVKVNAVVNDDAKQGQIVNHAIVDSPDDPRPPVDPTSVCQDNSDLSGDSDQCDQVPVDLAGPHLRINKVGKLVDGDTVEWFIEVGNDGPGTATEVKVTDLVPSSTLPGSVLVVDAPTQGTFSTDTNVWTIGTLKKGQAVSIRISTDHTHAALVRGVRNVAIVDSPDNPAPGTPDNCQVNRDLSSDSDQCDADTVKVPGAPKPPSPPLIDSGVPVIGGATTGQVAAGVGLIAAAGAGLLLLWRRRRAAGDAHEGVSH